jgi:hypothetical protein
MADHSTWRDVRRDSDTLVLVRSRSESAKIGIEADRLIATYGDLEFSQTAAVPPGANYAPGERSQSYAEPDKPTPTTTPLPYVELEFTGPIGSNALDITWRLTRPTQASSNPAGH